MIPDMQNRRTWLRGVALLAFALCPAAQAQAQDSVVTLGGDMIGPYRSIGALDDPGFTDIAALFRTADTGFANQEGAIFDLDAFDGFPASETGGGYPRSPLAVATDLAAMGINLVSKANNHATDWGVAGLLATTRSLSEAQIAIAGTGADAASACAPAYRQAKGGEVALVSAATTFPPMSLPAAPVQRRGTVSRPGPGICAIHAQPVRLVTATQLRDLARIAGPVGIKAGKTGEEVRIGDQRFRGAPRPGLQWEMKADDVTPVLSALGSADGKADLVIFAVHAHQTAGHDDPMPPADFEPIILHQANEVPSPDDPTPADFVPDLLHRAVDAGADIVVRTGPHVLNGIEVYKGKPIFYSLGSLFFDFGGRRSYAAPGGQTITLPKGWYETVVVRVTHSGKRIKDVRLFPAMIDPDAGPGGGLPHRATGADATRILTHLRDLSRPFGTEMVIKGEVGVVRIPAP